LQQLQYLRASQNPLQLAFALLIGAELNAEIEQAKRAAANRRN
jgi:hypothetical protein